MSPSVHADVHTCLYVCARWVIKSAWCVIELPPHQRHQWFSHPHLFNKAVLLWDSTSLWARLHSWKRGANLRRAFHSILRSQPVRNQGQIHECRTKIGHSSVHKVDWYENREIVESTKVVLAKVSLLANGNRWFWCSVLKCSLWCENMDLKILLNKLEGNLIDRIC